MYVLSICFTFGVNIAFNRVDPPLAVYMFFLTEENNWFYIGNMFYQFYVMAIIGIGAVLVEAVFILLTMFIRARFQFVRLVLQLIDNRTTSSTIFSNNKSGNNVSDKNEISKLEMINIAIELHTDVLM